MRRSIKHFACRQNVGRFSAGCRCVWVRKIFVHTSTRQRVEIIKMIHFKSHFIKWLFLSSLNTTKMRRIVKTRAGFTVIDTSLKLIISELAPLSLRLHVQCYICVLSGLAKKHKYHND